MFTGIIKHTGKINKILRKIRVQTHKVQELLIENDDVHLGLSLNEGWQLKREIASKVSSKTIDSIIDNAKNLGCSGGKLLGAGSDGFLLLSHPNHSVLSQKLGLRTLPIAFEQEGSKIIFAD